MRTRNASTRALVPQACELALGRLDALGRLTAKDQSATGWGDRWLEGPVVETLPDFLDMLKEVLVTQWHCFVPSAASRGMVGISLANAIAARAHQQASAARGGSPSSTGGAEFASEAMATHFAGLMSVLRLLLSLPTGSSGGGGGGGVGGHSVPPDLVRRGLYVLEASHRGGGLFRFPPFVARWLQPMLTDALRGLAEGAHPLLQEEVRHLVFDMAEVDHRAFVTDFLPQFLDTYYPWLGAAQKEALVSPWRAGTHLDVPTFSSFLEAFVSDLAFFRAQAEAG